MLGGVGGVRSLCGVGDVAARYVAHAAVVRDVVPPRVGGLGRGDLVPGKYVRGDALEEEKYALDKDVPEQGGD